MLGSFYDNDYFCPGFNNLVIVAMVTGLKGVWEKEDFFLSLSEPKPSRFTAPFNS